MNPDWTPYVAITTNIVRHLLTAAGASGVIWARTVTGSEVEQIVGVLFMLASVAWGVVQKVRTQATINVATTMPPISPPPKVPA